MCMWTLHTEAVKNMKQNMKRLYCKLKKIYPGWLIAGGLLI